MESTETSNAMFTDAPASADKKLSFTKSFTLDYKSEEDGKRYVGTFTCQRLTIGASGQVRVMLARLNGGHTLDSGTNALHFMIAYLSFALTSTPEWWDPENSYDLELLRKIFDYVRQWESSFRKDGSRE